MNSNASKKTKALVLVTDGFGGQGGIALYIRHLLHALCEIECFTEIVAVPRTESRFTEVMPAKLNYRDAAGKGNANYLLEILGLLPRMKEFRIIICGHINLLPLASRIGQIWRIPVVLVLYGLEAWARPGIGGIDRMLGKVSAITAIGEVTRKRFLSWSGYPENRIQVINNGIDLALYSPGPRPGYLLDRYGLKGKKTILTIGRMDSAEKAKGFDQVLEVMPSLLKRLPDLVYLVVGEGSDRERLERKSRELGIVNSVKFTGEISETEKADHYRLANAYVMPSRYEGFGYVFLEALACGLPVVGSSIDGSRDALLDGEIGALVDPSEASELEEAIWLAIHTDKSVPAQLSQFSLERYSSELRAFINPILTSKLSDESVL